jgi:hypothetical protein
LGEESDSYFFWCNELVSFGLVCHFEPPQSVVQGRPAQGSAVWTWKEQGGFAPGKRFTIKPALIGPAQPAGAGKLYFRKS